MKLPRGFVFPDLFNLGIAPPPPQFATRFAQRAVLLQPTAMGDVFNAWGGTDGLVLNAYFLPPTNLGDLVQPPLQDGLMPNPYNSAQW